MSITAYLRVSTSEQVESGLGLEAQLSSISGAFGEPDRIYRDEGFSGGDPNRPALLACIESLRRDDILAVVKRDRLARDVFLSAWIQKEAKRRGARIVSVAGEGTEADDPASVLLRHIIDAFAEFEKAQIGSRTAAALKAKRNRGEKTGGDCPFGFDTDGDGILTPNEAEQETIMIIQELRSEGRSLRQIAAELERQGVPTKRGSTTWQPRVIGRLLTRAA